ncbi:ATP-binding cassette domain-containing protein [Streptomyces sp. MS1.AVA.1]|uniref:ATP-binding cassette domain-containing protein n=1 Tax=Streptomyces machairae TaxID=3134109 RepID=A0ABU8UKP2_9ACTN
MSGIRFDSVSVAYDGNVVLDSLDLTVEPGEVMALLGPSGSGKTTALRAVAGFVRPASGGCSWAVRTSPTCRRTGAASGWSSSSTRCSRTCGSRRTSPSG